MLNIQLDQKPPSIIDRANIMRRHISKGGVPVDYDRLLEYLAHSRVEQYTLGLKILAAMNTSSTAFTPGLFKGWLKENKITIGFSLTEKGNMSLNEESVTSFVNTNAYGDDVTKVVALYGKYTSLASQVSAIPKILENCNLGGLESEDGRRVVLLKPGVEVQNTGRFGLIEPAFMNLPRYMKDLTVAPKGWTLMSADSSQIEPMLIYGFFIADKQINRLIELYGDAYYAILHYCKMPESDLIQQTMDFKIEDTSTPEMKELRVKLKTFGNGVMYGSTYNPDNDPLKAAYIRRIGQHPLRIAWQKKLQAQLDSGQRTFPTLFGTPIDVYQSKKYKEATTEQDRQLALSHCIINNPVQGTAGDLMGFSLEATDRLMSEKAPYSWITKYVHDEGQYCIHNSELDAVLEEISGHTSYNIGGIVKIKNEPKIGRTFNVDVPTSYEHFIKGVV